MALLRAALEGRIGEIALLRGPLKDVVGRIAGERLNADQFPAIFAQTVEVAARERTAALVANQRLYALGRDAATIINIHNLVGPLLCHAVYSFLQRGRYARKLARPLLLSLRVENPHNHIRWSGHPPVFAQRYLVCRASQCRLSPLNSYLRVNERAYRVPQSICRTLAGSLRSGLPCTVLSIPFRDANSPARSTSFWPGGNRGAVSCQF